MSDDNTISRREFLGGLGAAGLTSLAGCASFLNGNEENDN
ncbi:MAG: twin-arginine translocation signal domain-containing protein, partial [Candidatus Nanosalina sp.]